jgi:hypothetical protein
VQDEGEGPLPAFLFEDRDHVVVGVARMDDQRQPVSRAAAMCVRSPAACASRGDLS